MNKIKAGCYLLLLLCAACNTEGGKNRGPIVLGDTSTIVTETEEKYLTNFVDDIQVLPREAEVPTDTSSLAAADTTRATDTATPPPVAASEEPLLPVAPAGDAGDGLHVNFKEVQVFLPGIEAKSFRNQNPARSNGVSYQLTDGNIRGNVLKITGATVTRVSQRYITTVIAKNELGTLNLESLGTTTEWRQLQGRNGSYTISGLEPQRLQTRNVPAANIRNAISRAARRQRLSRQTVQKWEQVARRITSVRQKPLSLALRSVMWKVEGRDARGRSFTKQVRLDMPL